MIRLSVLSTTLFTGLLVIASSRAIGAEWKLQNVSAVTYNEIVSTHGVDAIPSGLTETRRPPPASVFLLLSYDIEVMWAKEDETLEIPYEQIGLYDGPTKIEPLGYLSYLGQGDFGSVGGTYYAPYELKPNPTRHLHKLMHIVPAKSKQFTLKVGTQEAKVAVTGPPTTFDPANMVTVDVDDVQLLEKVDVAIHQGGGDAKVPIRLTNEGGSIMQLTLSITPKMRNSNYKETFSWSPSWIHLTFGRGGRAVCAGTIDYDQVSNSTQSVELTPDGKWPAKQVTLYFPVPSNLKTFGVTFLGRQVATGAAP